MQRDPSQVEPGAARETREWIERVVIGLELCPFAAEPWREGRVRIAVSAAADPSALAEDLVDELRRLDRTPAEELETTLLAHPGVLGDFADYNDFLDVCDWLLERLDWVGTFQIASFHPDYRFAGAADDDVANATNRSPHPMLHLLREASVERALRSYPAPAEIPRRNAERLRKLGWSGLLRLRDRRRASAPARSSG